MDRFVALKPLVVERQLTLELKGSRKSQSVEEKEEEDAGIRKVKREQRGEAQPMAEMEEVRLCSHALPESGQDGTSSPCP